MKAEWLGVKVEVEEEVKAEVETILETEVEEGGQAIPPDSTTTKTQRRQ